MVKFSPALAFSYLTMHNIVLPANWNKDIFVDSSVRGSGLGRKLIEAVRDIARSRDYLRVAWITGNDNVAAQGLYNKLGTSLFKEYRMAVE